MKGKKFAAIIAIALIVTAFSATAQEVKVAPSKGIAFSADNVSLNIGGRIQVRHTYDGESEHSNFNIPRIRLALKGSIYQSWKWEFQSDFAKKDGTTLKDGLLEYTASEAFSIRAGQTKVRFDRQQLESSGRQTFVDRSIASRSLGMGRDVGVLVHGRFAEKKIQYSAGVFNGGGEGGSNVAERGHTLVGRVSFNPLGDFGLVQGDIKPSDKHLVFIDLAFAQQPEAEESFEGSTRYVFGAGYRYSGIYIAGEYYGRGTSDDIKSDGLYAQASYMVAPEKFELAGRFSTVDPNKDGDDDVRTEIMGGFNVYFNKLGHSMKLTGDVAMLKNEAVSEDSELRTRLQLQIVF
ncbi:MAG TPA: hypothetical protein ENN07_02165 [candidate division Zixibacteria bacterium]|nr:hypothetical protein [candidate division Zixibacteria bacterium]